MQALPKILNSQPVCPPNWEVILPADPAAGAEVSYTADTDLVIIGFKLILVTSAVVANRVVKWVADDGANVFAKGPSSLAHVASTTIEYVGFGGSTIQTASGNVAMLPFPEGGLPLLKGHRLITQTDLKDAGDNYGQPVLLAYRLS